jgi:hypothetical protein
VVRSYEASCPETINKFYNSVLASVSRPDVSGQR